MARVKRGKIKKKKAGQARKVSPLSPAKTGKYPREEALKESEERYRKLFDEAMHGIALADAETGILLDCNESLANLVGRTKAELIGQHQTILHPSNRDSAEFSITFKQHLADKEGQTLEGQVITKTGEIKEVEIKANILHIRGREVLQGIFSDITERKKAEEALRESEEKYRFVVENCQEGIWAIDENANTTFVNQKMAEMLGYKAEEMMGASLFEFMDEEWKKIAMEKFERRKQGISEQHEFEFLKKNGEKVWTSLSTSPLYGPEKNFIGALAFVSNITQRKSLEEQLRQAMKMEAIGLLAGGVAHDFNNKLTPIFGLCSLMLAQLDRGHPYYADIEEIQNAGERCASLVRQLMAFSRKQVLDPKVINLNEVVANMEKMLKRVIGEDIALKIMREQKLNPVKADIGQVEQIIMNLAANSRDAMPQGGSLVIETRNVTVDEQMAKEHIDFQPGSYAMLKVTDTGVGMGKATLAHIFEPFFTTKEAGKGTGLGLSMVYGIVKQSGGNIQAWSELGKGTSFEIYLPQAGEEPGEDTFSSPEARKTLAGTETILLVEDEVAIRKVVNRVLKKLGYNVISADSGEEAAKIFRQYPTEISLLITDVVMPGISGQDLANTLLQENPELKVIYISGYTDDAIARHGIIEEGTFFIQKPFSVETLAAKIRQLLDRKP